MANLDALMTSARTGDTSKDEWRTPKWLFDELDSEFDFDLDPAATVGNKLCSDYYTKDMVAGDGLSLPWYGSVFVNPPYSKLSAWVAKGYMEAKKGNTDVVVMLIPARTDTVGWWGFVRWGKVRFLPGRLKFGMSPEQKIELEERNLKRIEEGKKSLPIDGYSAPFPSALVVFNKGLGESSTMYWNIRDPKIRKTKGK